ncbi:multiple PDZ domain protein-like isoform X1 [Lytechinus pictus]|uniref:multiple PDZ domain protein-like isoform X1 n=1 Tax=Lytechinus pictus TaxID=7653 RepID=UPI0030BA197B
MAVVADTQRAVSVLQGLQGRLMAAGEPELGEQFASMIDLLASPSFRHLLNLQQSVRELKHHLENGPPGQTVEDFSFTREGQLVVPDLDSDQEPEQPYRVSIGPQHPYAFENKVFEGDEGVIKKNNVAPVASAPLPQSDEEDDSEDQDELMKSRSIPLEKANEDLEQALRELALGREVLSIELLKSEGRGLGFSVVGLKSENQGELGIFVQQIQKNGVAARDGNLQESDQILAINGALVDSSVSHKQAIGMLQKVKDKVHLIVARGGLHIPTPSKAESSAPPGRSTVAHEQNDLSGMGERGLGMEEPGMQAAMMGVAGGVAFPETNQELMMQLDQEPDDYGQGQASGELDQSLAPNIEVIDLYNKGSGLGFGIVGVRDIGIVVKTIVPGGAAEEDGRLQSGDIILRIGETDLEGMNSDQVASVLRQSGSHVQLVVARGALPVIQSSPAPPMEPEVEGRVEEGTRLPPQGLDLLGQGQMELDPLPVSPPPNLSELTSGVDHGEVFEVELAKGNQGLGLSIAGFIKKTPDGGETSGIFVKKIAEGSAADMSGNIHVGDQIIEVDGVNVQGYDNKAAVDLLRQTGAVVMLRLVRFPPEQPQLEEPTQQAHAAPLPDLAPPSLHDDIVVPEDTIAVASSPFSEEDSAEFPQEVEESFEGELSPEEEIAIMALWQGLLGLEKDIVIAQLSKFHEGGSLGISLEGTVDIDENGQEVQPHHYIRSIQPEGPVGQNGLLASGDELLEVNGTRLLGLNHEAVVTILKDLPQHVRLVCARSADSVFPQTVMSDESLPSMENPISDDDGIKLPDFSVGGSAEPVEEQVSLNVSAGMEMTTPMLPALDDSGSPLEYSIQTEASQEKDSMWSEDIQYIELEKGDRGLGFSILDYQDPDNPVASVIVIRSLVPGGVAEQDGRLIPGDRLVSVNESNLENCTLDAAVQVLKGAPRGLVTIGVAKPASGMESEETQIVSAMPAMVQESPPPMSTTTPMLPDVDISPLAAGIMAKEAMEEAEREIAEAEREMETEMEVKPISVEVPAEPAIVAAEVSVSHSAPPAPQTPDTQTPTMPPDLVSSITVSDSPKPEAPVSSTPPPVSVGVSGTVAKEEPSAPATPPHPKRTPPKPPPKPILRQNRFATSPSSPRSTPASLLGPRGYSPPGSKGFSPSSTFSSSATITLSHHRQASLEERSSDERVAKMVPMRSTPPIGRRKSSNVILPPTLEETIVLKRTNAGLGLTVSADKANGVVIKSIIRGGCVQQDGRLSMGDYITGVNGESMRNLSNNTARGVLRRSFMQGTDITVTYIPATKAASLLESSYGSPMGTPPLRTSRSSSVVRSTDSSPSVTPNSSMDITMTTPPSMTPPTEATPSEESEWEDVKTVTVTKEPGRSLGISIVGGRAGGDGQVVQGIFIKHVLENSPAWKTGQLKTGDRILEVNGCDLREATHDQAVAVIRNASNPMHFQVQSLRVGSPAAIMEDDVPDSGSIVAMATVVQAGAESDDNLDAPDERREVDGESDSESEDEFGYTWKKLSQRYNDLDGELHVIELNKGDRGLGLSLAGNKDRSKTSVFVVGVNPSGAAGKDGRILIGDEVLEINGIKVYGHSHQNASSIIGGLAPGTVKVVLVRNSESLNQLAVPPVIYPNQTSMPTILKKHEAVDEADSGSAPVHSVPEPEPVKPIPTPEDYPNVKHITLQKGPRGLGFAIFENQDEKGLSGIFVKDVTMGGPAAMEGNLKVGDQILAVNDKSVIGLSKLSAISVLKDTRGSVALTVSAAKPVSSPRSPQKNLFPTLDLGGGFEGGVSISATGQPDVFAGAPIRSQIGHADFFPALDNDEEPNSFHASTSINYQHSTNSDSSVIAAKPSVELRSDVSPTSDPLTCPVIKGHKTLIVVDRGHDKGLGISLIGGADKHQATIMIQNIKPDGAVAKDGRLQPGDHILEVDGLDFKNISHEAALNVLRNTTSKVRMLVLREDSVAAAPNQGDQEPEEGEEIFTVVLHQPAGQSLGLSIAGKGGALYISDIAPNSVADSNSQLMRGDQIIAVNGRAVKNIPQEALATLRQNAEGDVSLKISRRKDGGGSRLSMTSFETVVTAQPITVEQSPSPGGAESRRADYIQAQESFGSSTEIISEEEEETSSSSGVKTVTLERGPDGLGFSIVGGYGSPHGNLPIYIKTVFDRGAAAVAKQLKRGDQILAVNGESLEGATHQAAVNLLKKARGQVILTVVT